MCGSIFGILFFYLAVSLLLKDSHWSQLLNIPKKSNHFYSFVSPTQDSELPTVSKYVALKPAKCISIVYDLSVNINLDQQEMNPSRGVLLKPRLASSNSRMHKTMRRARDNAPAG